MTAKTYATCSLIMFLVIGAQPVLGARADSSGGPPTKGIDRKPRLAQAYGRVPLRFEPNQGQSDSRVRFLARGTGFRLFLTPDRLILSLQKPASTVAHLRLVGANPNSSISGISQLEGSVNYFVGNDPIRWRTNISTYAKVQYAQVYPGIDLIYYGNEQQLEYDFVVAPGADPQRIVLAVEGADKIELNGQGDLAVHLSGTELLWRKPLAYQVVNGNRREIESRYVLDKIQKGQVGFGLGAYDHRKPLVIDPVLAYATFLGGVNNDFGWAIAVDASGNAYVTGSTFSVSDFPTTTGVVQPASGGGAAGSDVFVTKFNREGTGLVYSTYLGGSGNDFGLDIALDSAGNAYLVGTTYAVTTFPTTPGAYQTNYGGGAADAFVAKLNPTGSALVYSTYLGGAQFDGGTDRFASPDIFDSFWHMGIAVDSSGNAFVAGTTLSPNFPTTPEAFQKTKAGAGPSDAFVTKLNPAGSGLIYSTYLGGSSGELGSDIAIDSAGNAYVVGNTGSVSDFPTTPGSFQRTNNSPGNAYVSKLNASGSALVYSTLLGGSGDDEADGVAVDSSGNAYVTGFAGVAVNPPFFPVTAGAFQTNFGGGSLDGFAAKFNPTGSALVYCTFLGGSQNDHGNAIAIDASGNAYILGHCNSADFPLKDPIQTYPNDGNFNVFVTQLGPSGAALVYSTYLGGNRFEDGLGIAVDSSGAAYLIGYTEVTANPPHFPTTSGAFRPQNAGNADAFIAKLSGAGQPPGQRPSLALARSGNTVRISWPSAATGFGLQMAGTLSLPINWAAVSTPPTVVGDQNVVTNAIGGTGRFYRLISPSQ